MRKTEINNNTGELNLKIPCGSPKKKKSLNYYKLMVSLSSGSAEEFLEYLQGAQALKLQKEALEKLRSAKNQNCLNPLQQHLQRSLCQNFFKKEYGRVMSQNETSSEENVVRQANNEQGSMMKGSIYPSVTRGT